MSLVFAGISAHTPLLVPSIGKDGLALIDKTRAALDQLEQDLYVTHPDTLIVITPHGEKMADAVTIEFAPKYVSNFEEFGDLATKLEWKSEIMLIDRIREDLKEKHVPLVLGSTERLDYGVSVPLSYLTRHLPNVRIVPMVISDQDMKAHYDFGKCLKSEISQSPKRIAVIASADLSHRVGENSPAGFSPKGVSFDEKITDGVLKRPLEILDIDEEWVGEAQACGAKVLATLCGVLDDVQHETKIISYEKPFGVGYLVANVKIG